MEATLFYILAAVTLIGTLCAITARQAVRAIVYLVTSFFALALIFYLLGAPLVAAFEVIIYAGAIMVLFLFVVMMLDINMDGVRKGFWKHFPLAAVIGVIIIVEMSAVLMNGFQTSAAPAALASLGQPAAEVSNTKALGVLLYTKYLYPLEIAAAILLVGMIAAIALTLRHRKDIKALKPEEQVRVKWADRLVVVKMDATQASVPAQVVETAIVENKA